MLAIVELEGVLNTVVLLRCLLLDADPPLENADCWGDNLEAPLRSTGCGHAGFVMPCCLSWPVLADVEFEGVLDIFVPRCMLDKSIPLLSLRVWSDDCLDDETRTVPRITGCCRCIYSRYVERDSRWQMLWTGRQFPRQWSSREDSAYSRAMYITAAVVVLQKGVLPPIS